VKKYQKTERTRRSPAKGALTFSCDHAQILSTFGLARLCKTLRSGSTLRGNKREPVTKVSGPGKIASNYNYGIHLQKPVHDYQNDIFRLRLKINSPIIGQLQTPV
jgi:hypothetical protein